jgi:hypothetical protein
MKREDLLKAGHYEIHGETIAKFEFFQNGFNPYSRYLDVDKVDLILRKKENGKVRFIEVQVKYGTLYKVDKDWYRDKFTCHSWKFFKLDEFKDAPKDLYIAYVLSLPNDYKGDIFIIPVTKFNELINSAVKSKTKKGGTKAKFMIAHDHKQDKWFVCTQSKFQANDISNGIDVTKYRRNFKL